MRFLRVSFETAKSRQVYQNARPKTLKAQAWGRLFRSRGAKHGSFIPRVETTVFRASRPEEPAPGLRFQGFWSGVLVDLPALSRFERHAEKSHVPFLSLWVLAEKSS